MILMKIIDADYILLSQNKWSINELLFLVLLIGQLKYLFVSKSLFQMINP